MIRAYTVDTVAVEVGLSTLCQCQHDDFIATGCNSTTNSSKKQYARKRDLKLCGREMILVQLPLVQGQRRCQMSKRDGRLTDTSVVTKFKNLVYAIYIPSTRLVHLKNLNSAITISLLFDLMDSAARLCNILPHLKHSFA
jgi:hypothetical protein